MQTIRSVADLRAALAPWREAGERIALVPTMGALHDGHIALIEDARRRAERVVASIFVNPLQFGPGEDLAAYPRREAKDRQRLQEAGCDLLWAPAVEAMYPDGFATKVSVAGVSEPLDGAARPGHFDGVATVVAKLFNQVAPAIALFGEKDFQQLAVIRRMVADMDFAIEIVGVPTQRADDGLALSSRNAYLSDEERARAPALPRAIGQAAENLRAGQDRETVLATAERMLAEAGFEVDYVALVDAETLAEQPDRDRPLRLLAAARLGATRLIDNLAV